MKKPLRGLARRVFSREQRANARFWLFQNQTRARLFSAPLRALPDFLIIGAQRGGTTSLYHYLSAHPQIGVPLFKEAHFFSWYFQNGMAWYRSLFPLRRAGLVCGEATPYYLFHPLAPARVAATLPAIKVIALLRNPVDRALSHFHLSQRCGVESLGFEKAIERETARLEGETERLKNGAPYAFSHHWHSYLARGHYAEQLEKWFAVIPRERILVIQSEQFYAEPGPTLAQTRQFLELEAAPDPQFAHFNQAQYAHLDAKLRARLNDHFAPHNARLERLLGREMGWN